MPQTKFISIEGGEGAGKSTVMKFVQSHLQSAGIAAALTREPGGTALAEKIRGLLLHDLEEKMDPATELLLMFAGRAQHINQFILPTLAAGKWVVSDRFIDASYAYQGGGRGIEMNFITDLDKHVVGKNHPDLTLLLDLPPELGFERTQLRGAGKDRIEQEHIDFFKRVREVYLQRAKQYPKRIKLINAALTLPEVEQQVAAALNTLITSNVS